jgi:hypothetical protein
MVTIKVNNKEYKLTKLHCLVAKGNDYKLPNNIYDIIFKFRDEISIEIPVLGNVLELAIKIYNWKMVDHIISILINNFIIITIKNIDLNKIIFDNQINNFNKKLSNVVIEWDDNIFKNLDIEKIILYIKSNEHDFNKLCDLLLFLCFNETLTDLILSLLDKNYKSIEINDIDDNIDDNIEIRGILKTNNELKIIQSNSFMADIIYSAPFIYKLAKYNIIYYTNNIDIFKICNYKYTKINELYFENKKIQKEIRKLQKENNKLEPELFELQLQPPKNNN